MANWRNVDYPALVENMGEGSKYRWVSPQENKSTGHFQYERKKQGNTFNAPFNLKTINGFASSSNSSIADAFANISGEGMTTIDLPGLPMGSPFGWSHEKNCWIYKNETDNTYFTANFKPVSGGRRRNKSHKNKSHRNKSHKNRRNKSRRN